MDLPKFFPLVIEIVIDCDGKQSFIARHANGNVLAILDDSKKISGFVDKVCMDLAVPMPSMAASAISHGIPVEKVKKPVRAK